MELELDTQSYNSPYCQSTHLADDEGDEHGAHAAQHWIAAEGPYRDYVMSLQGADPRLRQRDPKAKSQNTPWLDAQTRVVVLDLEADSTAFSEPRYFTGAQSQALEDFLATDPAPPSGSETRVSKERRRVVILEGLSPTFIALLGQHFGLHPSIFVEHERVLVMNMNAGGESDGLPLPSALRLRDHMVMKYHEPMELDPVPSSFRLSCGSSGRHIATSRFNGVFSQVGIVRRKCSWWSKTEEDGRGWECLVICDPPVTKVRTGEGEATFVKARPYQGGYVDFMPQVRGGTMGAGPPRTAMLNDLVYYLRTEAQHVDLARAETSVGVFVRKMIASHYLKHSEHLRATLSYMQRGLSRKQDLALLTMEQVEELWSDIQAWERRMGEYCEDLEAIMLPLGIPLSPPSLGRGSGSTAWTDSAADYQFLLTRLRALRHRTECLNSAITGLANIAGNRQAYKEQQLAVQEAKRSIREAKSTKAITLLGLFFIPLAYTSSLFSMTDAFAPGGLYFWVYWAASFPLILLVLLGYYVLDWGYTDDGAAWSPVTFRASLRKRLGRPEAAAGTAGTAKPCS